MSGPGTLILAPGDIGSAHISARMIEVDKNGQSTVGRLFWDTRQVSTKPMDFVAGGNQFVPGLDQGILGMHSQEIRRFEIPAEEAYGAKGES